MTKLKEGDSPLVKRKGKGTIVKFKIVQNGKEIIPWKNHPDAEIMEWLRNASAMLGEEREEMATFYKVEKDQAVYYEDSMQKDHTMKMAYFSSEVDGREYNVAARLLDKDIKIGDRVWLTILGCCSIISVRRIEE